MDFDYINKRLLTLSEMTKEEIDEILEMSSEGCNEIAADLDFKRKCFLERLLLSKKEYGEYMRLLRENEFCNSDIFDIIDTIKKINVRKYRHHLLVDFMELKKNLSGQTLTIIGDKRLPTDKPTIYACTHNGDHDIEMALLSIKDPCYLFMGGPTPVYRTIIGVLLEANGLINVELDSKSDRHIGKLTAIRLLKLGASILIYPEGAWNITENEIVMKLFSGVIDIALKAGAVIVPMALEQDGKNFYANIGENIDYSYISEHNREKLTMGLRNILATLKWDIWERLPVIERSNLGENCREEYFRRVTADCGKYYTVENILNERFKSKDIVTPDEIYSFIRTMVPNKNNAFLYRK